MGRRDAAHKPTWTYLRRVSEQALVSQVGRAVFCLGFAERMDESARQSFPSTSTAIGKTPKKLRFATTVGALRHRESSAFPM